MMFKTQLVLAVLASTIVKASPSLEHRQSSPLPSGWVSIGCYTDDTASRTLKTAATSDVTGMTIEECIAFCTPAAYQFGGVEFGRASAECYCDNIIESPGVPATDGCNMPCTGNSAEICGGANRINIFNNTAVSHVPPPPPPPPPPTASIKKTVGNFQYKGCFQDAVNGAQRSLLHQVSVPAGVSAETCTAACKAAGFPLAGLEFGQECWCDTYMPLVIPAPDSDCNAPCQADSTELCGSGNRLAVYQDTTAPPPGALTCLTNAQFLSQTQAFRFDIQAIPNPTLGSAGVHLSVPDFGHDQDLPAIYHILGGNLAPVHTFNFANNTFWPDNLGEGIPVAQAVSPGVAQTFITQRGHVFAPFSQYCAMPNPVGLFGLFIGPATLAVNGRNDQWGLCTNVGFGSLTGPVFQPQPGANQVCQNVVLAMIPPTKTSTCNGC